MKPYLMLWQFARVVAVVVVALVVALALIHSRRGEEALALSPLAHDKADVPLSELACCRSVAPGDIEVLESCRRLSAGIRQRFFASSKSSSRLTAFMVVPLVIPSSTVIQPRFRHFQIFFAVSDLVALQHDIQPVRRILGAKSVFFPGERPIQAVRSFH